MYSRLGLGEPKPTNLMIEMADKSIQVPRCIIENVLVHVDKFIFPANFVILDMVEDFRVPSILERPFLVTAHAKIDVFNKLISLEIGDEKVKFKMDNIIDTPLVRITYVCVVKIFDAPE